MKIKYYIGVLFILFAMNGFSQSQMPSIDGLKRMLPHAQTDTAKVNLYNTIADKFKELDPDSTAYYATKSYKLSQKANYNFGLATAYFNLGNSNIILGNYKKANFYFDKAQLCFENELADNSDIDPKRIKNGMAKVLASHGVVFSQQSNYFMALELYQKALKIYLEIGEKHSVSKSYNNIGVVYKSQQKNTEALYYFKKALEIQLEIGEPAAAVSLMNIGVIYAEQKNLSEAFRYYNMSKKLFEKNDNKRGFALLNNYYGDFYRDKKEYSKAARYYNEALRLYEEMQNKFGASLALYNLGVLNSDLKKYDEAIVFATKSLAYARNIGVLDQTYHSEKLLSELYGFKNNPQLSFYHYKNYIIARDSVVNQDNNEKMVRFEMESEYKRKAALVAEEAKRNTQLTMFLIIGIFLLAGLIFVIYNRRQIKRRLTLQKEVAEYEQKALHLQMNPHFVFNCLGSISSFIVQNGTDSALKYLSKFSKLMRLTLEYSKGALIPIEKEIESLQNYLELEQLRFHNKFEFALKSSDKVEFNMGIPPLLIQPFVENAILHGMVPKEGKGKIEVNFDVYNGQFICTITDDGVGISKSKHLKQDSVTAHKSMALEITKKRLEIMEAITLKSAQIDIQELKNREEVVGTKVTLQLPIQYLQ